MNFTCLPTSDIAEDVYQSILAGDKLPALKEERLFVDSSTIYLILSKALAASISDTCASHFIDTPVSSGEVGARAGTLSFIFGAPSHSSELIERVKAVLMMMGEHVWHMGEQSSGVSSELVNNYLLAINNIATSGAMNMGRHWGLDMKALTELISHSTGHCWPVEVNNPVPGVIEGAPSGNDYEPGCPISMINKDLKLAMSDSNASGVSLALAEMAHEVYNEVDKEYGWQGPLDCASVAERKVTRVI